MCRRILASISSLVARKLAKPELQKPDRISKLLTIANHYVEQWHSNLVHFISKTNPKLNIAPGFLEELAAATGTNSNRSSRRNSRSTARVDSPAQNKLRMQRKSLLVQIMKPDNLQPENSLESSLHESEREDENDHGQELLSAKDLNGNLAAQFESMREIIYQSSQFLLG